ncbi:hypothetical protein CYMTET_21351 [Cymbomonas tetramitiformis]|uniref:Uncharacterized protein n=1 Tax=Cymbomonas tetramitiformis TaxID=36881 RepID=A0AAE0G3I6_9CHLO|nr:hypothetical protein CYMTET_21351 [Cymbomonas tetramitiformis]
MRKGLVTISALGRYTLDEQAQHRICMLVIGGKVKAQVALVVVAGMGEGRWTFMNWGRGAETEVGLQARVKVVVEVGWGRRRRRWGVALGEEGEEEGWRRLIATTVVARVDNICNMRVVKVRDGGVVEEAGEWGGGGGWRRRRGETEGWAGEAAVAGGWQRGQEEEAMVAGVGGDGAAWWWGAGLGAGGGRGWGAESL